MDANCEQFVMNGTHCCLGHTIVYRQTEHLKSYRSICHPLYIDIRDALTTTDVHHAQARCSYTKPVRCIHMHNIDHNQSTKEDINVEVFRQHQ